MDGTEIEAVRWYSNYTTESARKELNYNISQFIYHYLNARHHKRLHIGYIMICGTGLSLFAQAPTTMTTAAE